jgi:hypothetical protein
MADANTLSRFATKAVTLPFPEPRAVLPLRWLWKREEMLETRLQ